MFDLVNDPRELHNLYGLPRPGGADGGAEGRAASPEAGAARRRSVRERAAAERRGRPGRDASGQISERRTTRGESPKVFRVPLRDGPRLDADAGCVDDRGAGRGHHHHRDDRGGADHRRHHLHPRRAAGDRDPAERDARLPGRVSFFEDRQSRQRHAAGNRLQPRSAGQDAARRTTRPQASRTGRLEAVERRGARVSPGDASGEAGEIASDQAVGAHRAVSRASDRIRSRTPLRRQPHGGSGADAGEAGRRGDRRRPVSWSAARDSLRVEGPVRGSRDEDDLGHLAVQGSGHRHRRHGVHEAEEGRRDPGRETVDRRAGVDRAVVRRRDAKPVEHCSRTRRARRPARAPPPPRGSSPSRSGPTPADRSLRRRLETASPACGRRSAESADTAR